MAVFEDAIKQLELILREDLPATLATISSERNDGIPLSIPVEYHWEEVPEKLTGTPAILLIPDVEEDPDQSDSLWDTTIQLYFIATDREKKNLSRRMLRYADAIRRILRKPRRRTLNQTVVSAKVIRVSYSPTFLDRDQLFARDFNAEIKIRLSRVGL